LPPGQFGKLTDEQCDPPKSRIGRFLMVIFLAATSVIAGDYEVLGLASDGRHYFWIFFFGLHGMSSR